MPHISLIAEAIDRLGGVAAAARALGRRRVTVERWLNCAEMVPAESAALMATAGVLRVEALQAAYQAIEASSEPQEAAGWAREAHLLGEAQAALVALGWLPAGNQVTAGDICYLSGTGSGAEPLVEVIEIGGGGALVLWLGCDEAYSARVPLDRLRRVGGGTLSVKSCEAAKSSCVAGGGCHAGR